MIRANKIEYWAGVGDVSQVAKAVAEGSDVNARSEGGYTALHAAAENNRVDVIKALAACGADITARVLTGETPLALAQIAGCNDAVQALEELERQQVT
jgi:uncharacterized protein